MMFLLHKNQAIHLKFAFVRAILLSAVLRQLVLRGSNYLWPSATNLIVG